MLLLNQIGSKLAMEDGNRKRVAVGQYMSEKCWVREVSLAVYACGERDPNSDSL